MSTRTLSRSWWWWVLGATALVWIISASVAAAGTKIRAATQTMDPTGIGPSDAPVRSAVLTSADRQQLKVEPARWWGGGWGWRGGYGYGAPYYAYYPTPYYSYPAPYYAYYSPPTYYSAAPGPYFTYYAPGPAYYYRAPRRVLWGGYYW